MKKTDARNVALYYLNNLLHASLDEQHTQKVCDWFEENSVALIGRKVANKWGDPKSPDPKKAPRCFRTIRKWITPCSVKKPAHPVADAICHELHFPESTRAIVTLDACCFDISWLEELFQSRYDSHERELAAAALNMTLSQYDQNFIDEAPLIKFEFIENQFMRKVMTTSYEDLLLQRVCSSQAVRKAVIGTPLKSTLQRSHFQYIRKDYETISQMVKQAIAKKTTGVNILIYGVSGIGKTELAKTICGELKVPLYAAEKDNDEHGAGYRRDALTNLHNILKNGEPAVALVDEAEDLLQLGQLVVSKKGESPEGCKLCFNQLLEQATIPTIWVCNKIDQLDESSLRRFSYIMKMDRPKTEVQERIWYQSARKNGMKLKKSECTRLARRYNVAPGLIVQATKNAAMIEDPAAIETTLHSLQSAIAGGSSALSGNESSPAFLPELTHCDTDLARLAERIQKTSCQKFSLCLYGVSGSGKSAYARYLARLLNREVLSKRASDLTSMYVGETEHLIAEAFQEAYDKQMLLVFDEVDSLLRDRQMAYRTWEIQSVNEMLTQMEHFPFPFICTTNLMETLDEAALRRFTFKIRYQYLTPAQNQRAFEHFFGQVPTVSLAEFTSLTPGDFATVANRSKIMGITDQKELFNLLRQEEAVKLKKDPDRAIIGFRN